MNISIQHVPHLNGSATPARCNRKTGEIWINDSVWKKIEPAHRMFILLHEYGHIALNSSDELEVDRYAMDKYVQMGYSLNESVKALSRVLTGSSDQHVERVAQQLERAKQIDLIHNKKKKTMCSGSCGCSSCGTALSGFMSDFNGDAWYNAHLNYDGDDYGGCDASKLRPRQYRKCVAAESKAVSRDNKSAGTKALKEGKGVGLQAKGEAKRILADQGIVDDSSSLNGAIRAAGTAIGGGAPAAAENGSGGGSKKTWLYVAIGAAVLVVGGIISYVVKRK